MAWKMSKICYEKMLCFFMNGAYFRRNRISSAFYIKSYYLIYRSIIYYIDTPNNYIELLSACIHPETKFKKSQITLYLVVGSILRQAKF